MRNVGGIVRARRAAAKTLLASLEVVGDGFSEADLAKAWHTEVARTPSLRPFGWYQPPPSGISVLIGKPPSFDRLRYESLREPVNWPSTAVTYGSDSILYPYLSAIDSDTGMIGDFVGTFYAGQNREVRSWLAAVYDITLRIAKFAEVGMRIREVHAHAVNLMDSLGGRNNTVSLSGGTAAGADVGHTIPGYGLESPIWAGPDVPVDGAVEGIAGARTFVDKTNEATIDDRTAFTIEPQLLRDDLPMASFHIIVAFSAGGKHIVQEFDDVFEYFGMSSWIRASGA
jgi:hypothetical protein